MGWYTDVSRGTEGNGQKLSVTSVQTKIRTKNSYVGASPLRADVPWIDPLPSGLTLRVCCGCKFGSGYRPRSYFCLVVMMAALTELSWPTWHPHDAQLSAFTENPLLRSLSVKFSTGLWFDITFRPYKWWDNLCNRPLCSLPQHSQRCALCSYHNSFVSVLGPMWGVYFAVLFIDELLEELLRWPRILIVWLYSLHCTELPYLLVNIYLIVRFPRKQSG